MQSDGVYNSNISNEVINFRVVESLLKKEIEYWHQLPISSTATLVSSIPQQRLP